MLTTLSAIGAASLLLFAALVLWALWDETRPHDRVRVLVTVHGTTDKRLARVLLRRMLALGAATAQQDDLCPRCSQLLGREARR